MLKNVTNETPIECLGLSNRTYNALKRADINSVGEVLSLSEEDISNIRQIGSISKQELMDLRVNLQGGMTYTVENNYKSIVLNSLDERSIDEDYSEVMFLNKDNNLQRNLSIDVLNLTQAKKDALKRNGFNSLLDIVEAETDRVRSVKSLGHGYDLIVSEIAKRILIYYPVNQTFETVSIISEWLGSDYLENEALHEAFENAVRARLYEFEGELAFESYEELLESRSLLVYVYRDELVRKLTEEYIVGLMKDSPVEYYELRKMAPISLVRSGRLDDILFEMTTKNIIEETEEGYQKYLPHLIDWIRTGIKQERDRDFLRKRISGMTLEEIGQEYGLTREWVRQREALAKKLFVPFKEEQYVYWYKKYDFTKSQFCRVFGLLPASYDSVKYLAGSLDAKRKAITDVLEDDKLTPSMNKRLRSVLKEQYALINDEYVPINEKSILMKIIEWKYSENPVRVEDLMKEYNSVLEEGNLSLRRLNDDEDRRIESVLGHCDSVIKREKRNYRFYQYKNYDFEEFFNRIDFSDFRDSEISVQKIMRMYPELMEEYDIRACYELHYLFQKYSDITAQYGVVKEVAPNIVVGTATREMQVKRFVYKLAPVSIEDFCRAYEEEYGVDAVTVAGTYHEFYDLYVNEDRVIDVTQDPMRDDELFAMKNAFPGDFYFTEDIEKKYKELFPNGNIEKVNHYNLKKMGFNVYPNFVLRNTFSSAEDGMCKWLLENGGVDPLTVDSRMSTVQQYYGAREILRSRFELFEIADGHFITFEKLKEKHPNVTKEDLEDYASAAKSYSAKDIYTVHSIRNAGFSHKLDDLNETERFYAGLIRSKEENTLRYVRVYGDFVFSKNVNIDKTSFLKNAVDEMGADVVDMTELLDYIVDEYGVFFDRYDAPRYIRYAGYYYARETGKVYRNREDYLRDTL